MIIIIIAIAFFLKFTPKEVSNSSTTIGKTPISKKNDPNDSTANTNPKNSPRTTKMISDVLIDKSTIATLRLMLKDIDHLFQSNNIPYWMDGGTLLGAIRHHDVIPWDDDGDLCILSKDKPKLLAIQNQLHEMGYGLYAYWAGYKIYPLRGKLLHNKDYKYPFVDIFLVSRQKCPKHVGQCYYYNYDKNEVKKIWDKHYHLESNLFPLKKYLFHDFYLFGPNNPVPYLDRAYGQNWQTKAVITYDHFTETPIDHIEFDL